MLSYPSILAHVNLRMLTNRQLDTPRIATCPCPILLSSPQGSFFCPNTQTLLFTDTRQPQYCHCPPPFFFAPLSTLPLEPFCGFSFAWPTAAQNEYRRVHGTTVCQRRPRGPKPRGHNRSPLLGGLDENGGETGHVLWFSLATPSWPSSA